MFDDFTPVTDLERAFAQAAGWEIEKLWKEADRSGDRKDWNRFYGQAFCLVYHCAANDQTRHLNTVTTAMLDCPDQLTRQQQLSLFKVAVYVVNQLLDQSLSLDSTNMRLVLRTVISIPRMPGWGNIELVEMAVGLTTIFGRMLQPEEIDKLAAQCEKAARESARMYSDEHTLLRWSVTKYSGG